jgi:phytoene desaturase
VIGSSPPWAASRWSRWRCAPWRGSLMVERADVVVVGAGVGGLAVAIRLAASGRRVVVFERNEATGGKLAVVRHAGATFDAGPSLVTLPHVFDELFRAAGTSLAAEVAMERLDPQFTYRWPDGSSLVVPDDVDERAAAFESFSPGAGAAWRRFDDHGRRIWDISERTFLAGPMTGPLGLARRMRSPRELLAIDPLRSLHRLAARTFTDPRLAQWAGRYATYSGSSPYRAPATLACIPHIEARHGCWYPRGGLDELRRALHRVAERVGVDVRTGVDVERIVDDGSAVTGVVAGLQRFDAPVVVANADAEQVYGDLLADERALRRVRRAPRSMSGLVVLALVDGTTPGVAHHTVSFSGDDRAEFDALAAGRMADDPTVYACVSTVSDPTQSPPGTENWFLLVNTPPGIRLDPDAERTRVLDVLAARGLDVRGRVRWSDVITPLQFAARTRAPAGAIYGTSSDGRRAAFLRPGNQGARRGLYLVGGSSHPGGGLPLVATSAAIVARMIGAP